MEKPLRIRALERATKYIGVKEHPAGTNRGPLIDRWCRMANGLVGYPWCSAFLCAMYQEEGYIIPDPRRASVGFFEAWAARSGYVVKRPFRGDVVCYRFDADNWPDHIGFIEKVLALRWRGDQFIGWVRTIEGNTSWGNDANGGQVQRRWRWINRAKFCRIPG